MHARPILAAVAIALAPAATLAEDFDYTYLEAGYVASEIDTGGVDADGDGFGLRGSWGITEQINLIANYTALDFDFDIDVSLVEAGAGWHMRVGQNVDLTTSLTWISAEVDTPFGDVKEDGYGLGVGLRGLIGTRFELEGGLKYADLGVSDTAFRLDGRYHFTPRFAAGGGAEFDDDGTTWHVGVRYEIDAR